MSDKKQTAVEWFLRKLYENDVIDLTGTQASNNLMGELYIQAKAMEKEQYETFFKQGFKYRSYIHDSIYGGADLWEEVPKNFDDYYKETYES